MVEAAVLKNTRVPDAYELAADQVGKGPVYIVTDEAVGKRGGPGPALVNMMTVLTDRGLDIAGVYNWGVEVVPTPGAARVAIRFVAPGRVRGLQGPAAAAVLFDRPPSPGMMDEAMVRVAALNGVVMVAVRGDAA